jgi:hypothetical protein
MADRPTPEQQMPVHVEAASIGSMSATTGRRCSEMEMRGAEGPPRACAADGSSTSAAAAAAIAFMRDASDASSPNIYCTGSEN